MKFGFSALGSDWPESYEKCGGKRQSPVDIKGAKCNAELNNSITFTNYDQAGSKSFMFDNTGHTVQLSLGSTGAKIKLGSWGTFSLVQLHFHWGKDNKNGSEHTMEGKAYPAEVRIRFGSYYIVVILTTIEQLFKTKEQFFKTIELFL